MSDEIRPGTDRPDGTDDASDLAGFRLDLVDTDVDAIVRERVRMASLATLTPTQADATPRSVGARWLLVPYGALLAGTGLWLIGALAI